MVKGQSGWASSKEPYPSKREAQGVLPGYEDVSAERGLSLALEPHGNVVRGIDKEV